MKTICFDLDGVLCSNTWGSYEKAVPIQNAINKVNNLYAKGYKIIIFTSRYMGRNNEDIKKTYAKGFEFTKTQLDKWSVNYHKLIMGKPSYDILVDDKHLNYNEDWTELDFN